MKTKNILASKNKTNFTLVARYSHIASNIVYNVIAF